MKPVVRRAKADEDIRSAIGFYRKKVPNYTEPFIEAFREALQHLSQHPGTGSPRYAHELDIPGLRFWKCTQFPYLVFYVERSDAIDLWRVLHESRDIPSSLQSSD